MGSKNVVGIASSRYRQIRVNITQEQSGRLSYSLYAKPLNRDWTEQHCIVRDAMYWERPVVTPEDAIVAAIEVLKQQLLPGLE